MSLFLCKFDLEVRDYPDARELERGHLRIVEAGSDGEADGKLRKAMDREDPYGQSRYVLNVDINEVIR